MTTLPLTALLVRRGGWRGTTALVLTALGVAASSVLALLAVSVAPAMDVRADRIAWRTPAVADADRGETALALQRTLRDTFEGRTIVRVELARFDGTAPPAPPGLRAFPAPGEVALSPALAALVDEHPDAALRDRFPAHRLADLGDDALAHDGELVAVVGIAASSVTADPDAATDPEYLAPGTALPITGFAEQGSDQDLATYALLARLAAVLLVVPCVLLIGAAARLTAAQREQRLAALRLAGASPGTVTGVTVIETWLAATAGVLLGVVAYRVAVSLVAHISLAGGTFTASDLVLGWRPVAAAVVAIPLVAAAAAAVALRRLVISPLGVARRTRRPAPNALRLLVVPVAWVAFSRATGSGDASEAVVLLALGGVVAAIAVVGPWLAWLLGRGLIAVSRTTAPFLAGRRITDDPRGAYRTVSGLVLAGVLAGFLFGVIPTVRADQLPDIDPRRISVDLARGDLDQLRHEIGIVDPGAAIELEEHDGDILGQVDVSSDVLAEPVRTAIQRAAPGAILDRFDGVIDGSATINADIERGAFGLAVAALGMAVTAAAVSGVSSLLDQRTSLARLRLMGTPIEVLQRARRWQLALPLSVAMLGALATGAVVGSTLMVLLDVNTERLRPPAFGPMGLLVVLAVVAGIGVVAVTRPVLESVSRSRPSER